MTGNEKLSIFLGDRKLTGTALPSASPRRSGPSVIADLSPVRDHHGPARQPLIRMLRKYRVDCEMQIQRTIFTRIEFTRQMVQEANQI